MILMGIIFVSFNLRPAITSVGPLVSSIRADLGISNGAAGFITTLPLLSFAALSFLAPKLSQRFGNERLVFVGMLILLAGIMIRSVGFAFTLFIGTACIGIGIAVANVLLPSIIKKNYPLKIGLMTATYTTSMSVFAAVGSGVSIPLAQGYGLGWQFSLLIWAGLALLAVLFWIPQLRESNTNVRAVQSDEVNHREPSVWRSSIAWQVTFFMGLQSFMFYCLVAWLPEILTSSGLQLSAAGWMLSIMQLAGLPMSFFTPVLADRFRNQMWIVCVIGVLYTIGLGGMLIGGSMIVFTLSVISIGLAQGSCISLALTLLGLRAANAKQAADLSGMAQSIGYLLAAIGPIVIGLLLDRTETVTAALLVFFLVALFMVTAGLGAGRNRTVFESKS
ncbi:CynX/NimT family MFS transporter [Desertibacillus haloalkaliphilus]|uniref:CynX/NimT family MFS transporter n=1 Tax=Desertibacillus haloalkaliphilus TaxID=1328930 RepID=UPI001FE64089|nr:MFS transporter [Desertibacillus haloalkaliphilus]